MHGWLPGDPWRIPTASLNPRASARRAIFGLLAVVNLFAKFIPNQPRQIAGIYVYLGGKINLELGYSKYE
jgi:hypothetical protein